MNRGILILDSRYNVYNPKRRIVSSLLLDSSHLMWLCSNVKYGGNPQHKRKPGDFGLTPPSAPRAAKSLCDEVSVFKRTEALGLLKLGIKKGLISVQKRGQGYPQNIWSVKTLADGRDVPVEAQL